MLNIESGKAQRMLIFLTSALQKSRINVDNVCFISSHLFTLFTAQIYLLHLQNLKMLLIHTCESKTNEVGVKRVRKEPRKEIYSRMLRNRSYACIPSQGKSMR